jgi:hypothetical protein
MTCRAILHLGVYKRELYVPYLYKAYGVCDATVGDIFYLKKNNLFVISENYGCYCIFIKSLT